MGWPVDAHTIRVLENSELRKMIAAAATLAMLAGSVVAQEVNDADLVGALMAFHGSKAIV